jgi:predicted alpha/beta superfamily hydrolase
MIIVAVSHSKDRTSDYSHVRDPKFKDTEPLAAEYGRLLVEVVKPLVDSRYRTLSERENTTLCGSSLAGIATAFVGLENPEVFGNLCILSPSVWWCGRDILKHVRPPTASSQKIWLDVGTAEGGEDHALSWRTVDGVRALRQAFADQKWGNLVTYNEFQGAGHDEFQWGHRFPSLLRWLNSQRP